tara:strand:+ start:534 stop:821 length:288 start_codon:yes stop_codon:yes gene_type:complete
MENMLDLGELSRRLIKYVLEGLFVALAAFVIPRRTLNIEEIMLISLTGAATFCVLDTWLPSIGASARSGAGFGIGANLVGFPGAGPLKAGTIKPF